jgi:hypothetical protein
MHTNDDLPSPADRLEAAVKRVCSPDSIYWLSRRGDEVNLQDEHEVEVRLDVDPQSIAAFAAPVGWRIAHTKPDDGMVFLRRAQPLTDEALKAMFVEVLTLADANNGRFHSWLHGSDLRDW